jgi:hypothetical protein
MSQAHVEQILGRLATDEAWRERFRRAPDDALDALVGVASLEISGTERQALLAMTPDTLDAFAAALDPRLQRLGVTR